MTLFISKGTFSHFCSRISAMKRYCCSVCAYNKFLGSRAGVVYIYTALAGVNFKDSLILILIYKRSFLFPTRMVYRARHVRTSGSNAERVVIKTRSLGVASEVPAATASGR